MVLFATTAGGILFGAVGGVFAGPFVKIGLDGYLRVKETGILGPVAAEAALSPAGAAAGTAGSGPPGPSS